MIPTAMGIFPSLGNPSHLCLSELALEAINTAHEHSTRRANLTILAWTLTLPILFSKCFRKNNDFFCWHINRI